jgi:hypothetical protein
LKLQAKVRGVLTAAVRFAGIFAGIEGANIRGEFRYSRTTELSKGRAGTMARAVTRTRRLPRCPPESTRTCEPSKISDATGSGLYIEPGNAASELWRMKESVHKAIWVDLCKSKTCNHLKWLVQTMA